MEHFPTPIALDYQTPPPSPPRDRSGSIIMAGLTFAVTVLAAVMLYRGLTTWLEAFSFITGAICVWLTVRENIWNFPIGIVNSAAYAIFFFQAKLYSDAGLSVVYLILGVIGWYFWLFGGAGRTRLHITLAPSSRLIGVILSVITICVGLTLLNKRMGDSVPFLDALTTAISLGAQWLLDRKHLENWILWIIADVIYVPMYLYQHLYLTSLLYAVFVVMAVLGLIAWHKTWRWEKRGLST
jgi:nicotinamide mononucleotide transporter